jgi:hypothetical protein
MLPVPPDESRDGTVVLTPETTMLVRDSSWARRRIAREDLAIVRPDDEIESMILEPGERYASPEEAARAAAEPIDLSSAITMDGGPAPVHLSDPTPLLEASDFEGRFLKAEALQPIADDTIDPEE